MASDPLLEYEVRGNNTVISHDGKDYREGDPIQLTKKVATELRHQLTPLSDEAAFDEVVDGDPGNSRLRANLSTMRDHEREGVLLAEKERLEARLDVVDEELAKIEKKPATEAAAPAPAPPAPQPIPARPAPAKAKEVKA